MSNRKIQPVVYVVDDDASVRHGLVTLLEVSGYPVEDFESGEALLTRNPGGWGCILLDVRMSGMDGLEVQQALIKSGNSMPVIFLTAFSDVPRIVRAVKEGAKDFFIKPVEGGALVNRVQQVLESYFLQLKSEQERLNFTSRMSELTEREREVLALSVEGLSCKDIGIKLGVSYRTVELHRSHICTKAGTANFNELFQIVAKLGYLLIN
ncbi:MAG: response regulator [Proteobacteria bacterium]|nr:response regulator [Pseudomonadota bacterium]